jgi:uncharacterized membrane protein YccC
MDAVARRQPHRLALRDVQHAVVYSVALAASCLISYWIVTQILAQVHPVSRTDDLLGGMWAVIATVFVYRNTYERSGAAASSRMAATLVSFALCLAYLLIAPFSVWGMATLIGVGALVVMLIGRTDDTVTTGVTTAVVMVVAALSPHNAWQQPILRLVDTGVGIAVGVVAAWIGLRLAHLNTRRCAAPATAEEEKLT